MPSNVQAGVSKLSQGLVMKFVLGRGESKFVRRGLKPPESATSSSISLVLPKSFHVDAMRLSRFTARQRKAPAWTIGEKQVSRNPFSTDRLISNCASAICHPTTTVLYTTSVCFGDWCNLASSRRLLWSFREFFAGTPLKLSNHHHSSYHLCHSELYDLKRTTVHQLRFPLGRLDAWND